MQQLQALFCGPHRKGADLTSVSPSLARHDRRLGEAACGNGAVSEVWEHQPERPAAAGALQAMPRTAWEVSILRALRSPIAGLHQRNASYVRQDSGRRCGVELPRILLLAGDGGAGRMGELAAAVEDGGARHRRGRSLRRDALAPGASNGAAGAAEDEPAGACDQLPGRRVRCDSTCAKPGRSASSRRPGADIGTKHDSSHLPVGRSIRDLHGSFAEVGAHAPGGSGAGRDPISSAPLLRQGAGGVGPDGPHHRGQRGNADQGSYQQRGRPLSGRQLRAAYGDLC